MTRGPGKERAQSSAADRPRLELQHQLHDRRPDGPPARSRHRHRRRSKLRSLWVSALLYVGLGLASVAVAGLAALVVLAPTDLIRDRIIAEVKSRTGRDLLISGATGLRFFPSPGLTFADISISAPPGMSGPPTVRMAGLDVSIAASALWSRRVAIERLVLRQPVFDLRIDARGLRSRDQADATSGEHVEPPRLIRLAQAAQGARDGRPLPVELQDFAKGSSGIEAGGQTVGPAPKQDVSLGDFEIVDGTINYTDERSNAAEDISAINMRLAMQDVSGPLAAQGTFVARRQQLTIDARLGALDKALAGQPVKLDLKIAGEPLVAAFDGRLIARAGGIADGTVALETTSLAGLIRYLGKGVADMPGLGGLKLSGRLEMGETSISLTGTDLALEGTTASGAAGVELGAGKPSIKAKLRVSELDLNTYGPVANALARAPTVVPVRARASDSSASPALRPAKGIGDLIEQNAVPAARVKGFTAVAGWSDAAFDLAALAAVDLEASLSLGRLTYDGIRIGESQTTFKLENGVLRVGLDDMQLYDGRGRGVVTLDATAPIALFGASISVDAVSAQPLLRDAAGFDGVLGKGRVSLALAGRGKSQRQLIESSTGKLDFSLTDGAVTGYDVPKMLRLLGQGRIPALEKSATEKTEFSEFAGSFAINRGVASNQDLRLVSPTIRAAGAGTINLGQRTLDFTLRPKIVAAIDGQGSVPGLTGIEVPVKVTGPWDSPKIAPDIDGLVKDPGKAIETIKEIGRQFKGKSAEEIVRGITSGEVKGPDGKPLKAQQLLDKFLKR